MAAVFGHGHTGALQADGATDQLWPAKQIALLHALASLLQTVALEMHVDALAGQRLPLVRLLNMAFLRPAVDESADGEAMATGLDQPEQPEAKMLGLLSLIQIDAMLEDPLGTSEVRLGPQWFIICARRANDVEPIASVDADTSQIRQALGIEKSDQFTLRDGRQCIVYDLQRVHDHLTNLLAQTAARVRYPMLPRPKPSVCRSPSSIHSRACAASAPPAWPGQRAGCAREIGHPPGAIAPVQRRRTATARPPRPPAGVAADGRRGPGGRLCRALVRSCPWETFVLARGVL